MLLTKGKFYPFTIKNGTNNMGLIAIGRSSSENNIFSHLNDLQNYLIKIEKNEF